MRLLFCLCLAAVLPLSADTLADLKTQLRALSGDTPLKASVEHQIWRKEGDPKKPLITQGKVIVWVEEGPHGLKLFWSRDLLQRALQEIRAKNADPEKTTPTRQAMSSLDTLALQDYFNSANQMLQDLETATLVEDRSDALDGKSARLLSFKVEPKMSIRDRKYVKELEATAKIWLDSSGVPIGAEQKVKIKGKVMVVIHFQSEERSEFRFARIGDRLVTVNHVHEVTGSGGGENAQSKEVTSLRFN